MDEEKLHSELNKRIRRVFDNYEDTGADEGWLLLRRKFPAGKKERSLAWIWYAAAAIVLLCLGIWLVPDRNKHTGHIIAVKKPVSPVTGSPVTIMDTSMTIQAAKGSIIAKTNSYQHNHSTTRLSPKDAALTKPASITPARTDQYVNSSSDSLSIQTTAHKPAVNSLANIAAPAMQSDSGRHNIPYQQDQTAQLTGPVSKKNTPDMFRKKIPDDQEAKPTDRKTSFSVYAATYVNYAKGSDNPINIGAGFTSDIRITRKLKLSTGLAIAQNRLNYSNDHLPNASQHEATFASLAAAAAVSSGKPLTGNGTMQSLVRYATTLDGSKNYNASLVGLDIPINLKYEFNPQKTDAYIAAGISSGTFMSETYRSVYTYSAISKESDTHNSFSGFDLAKTLNVSFGVGYALGKNRLIVEPFLKYPLDGLGAQQIKFGSSGVNLKLNFSAFKK
jgi:hypothetical protein